MASISHLCRYESGLFFVIIVVVVVVVIVVVVVVVVIVCEIHRVYVHLTSD